MKNFFLIIVSFFISNFVSAQVKGIILDSSNKQPVDKATVSLIVKAKPKDTIYTTSNTKGEFSFSKVPTSNFSVIITSSGYKPVAKLIPVALPMESFNIGTIYLSTMAQTLGEVVVEAPSIVLKEDTVEYHADAFKVKPGSVVEDLLKKLPGITVDKTGKIMAGGKEVTRIKVNGKDFFGGDAQTASKELPADIVEKVQVVDDYGDQANFTGIKDGDPEKVINLQLKKDKNKGVFGRATAGYGTQQRYQASFNTNFFNNNRQISLVGNTNNTNSGGSFNFGNFGFGGGGLATVTQTISLGGGRGGFGGGGIGGSQNSGGGIAATNSIGLNYRDQWGPKLGVYGSYSKTHRNVDEISNTVQQSIFGVKNTRYDIDNTSKTITDNHRATFNIEYTIDSFNYLKISPNFNYGKTFRNTNSTNITSESSLPIFGLQNRDSSNSKTPNFSNNILFTHKFRKRGRTFSANLSMSANDSKSDGSTVQKNIFNLSAPGLTLLSNSENKTFNTSARLSYTEPISKTNYLEFNYSFNYNYSKNEKLVDTLNTLTNERKFSSQLSNSFEANSYNHRLGINIRTVKKKYNFTIGISAQPVIQQGKSLTTNTTFATTKRLNLAPIARFAYNFTRTKTLNLNYNGNARQPGLSQLQPVRDVSNIQFQKEGNPNLKPEFTHNVNVLYNNFNAISGRIFLFNTNFSTTINQIVNNVDTLPRGAQLTRPENANGNYSINAFYNYSVPYKNRMYVLSIGGSANYNNNISLVNLQKNIGKNFILSQNANLNINLKDWLDLGVGGSFSLNDVKYSINKNQNNSYRTYVASTNARIDFLKGFILRYDFDYTFYNGLDASVARNIAILNASIEREIFKNRNGVIRISAFDLLNQQTNISRTINDNFISDNRTNRLTRYFLFSFQYRFNKFTGQRPQGMNRVNMGN